MLFVEVEKAGDGGGRLNAHTPRMVISWALARASGLDVAL